MNNKVRDIENFCKLFKVPCTVEQYFEYYIDCLIRGGNTKLRHQLSLYQNREVLVENMYQDKKKYFTDVIDYLHFTPASLAFRNALIDVVDHFNPHREVKINKDVSIKGCSTPEYMFVSIDMVSANYQTLRQYDFDKRLPEDWETFLRNMNVPEVYVQSKNFRQYVFEQSNPKQTHMFQKHTMSKVLHTIDDKYGDKTFVDNHLVFRSHDEVIFAIKYPDDSVIDLLENIETLAQERIPGVKLRVTWFKNRILHGDKMLRTYVDPHEITLINRVLKNIPGWEFYMYHTKYVLQEAPNEIDSYFMHEKKLAKWINYEI